MPDPIEPALTAEQWASVDIKPKPEGSFDQLVAHHAIAEEIGGNAEDGLFAAAIALANAALPDDDPRKITRERVDELRSALGCFQADRGRLPDDAATERFLDALESYLPPAA